MSCAADGPNRARAWWRHPAAAPVGVLAAGAVGAFHLYGTNPHEPGHWLPRCPFQWATGQLCPACGGTRMVYDLMHGQFTAAWHDNRMLLLAAPFALALLGRWAWEGLRGRRWQPRISGRGQAAILVTALVWTVLRNVF
ncbi:MULTISPECIES: DUF2752 domain-containing protein [unclassified Streptomyces]|uniref:DUF2752 domain-containing protein n=1 Tax=unclassified Streptomyces TaxID=2593676 RepID=UPI000DBA63E8|nr:DUF2752 domain-containing protein [Streptomyces sp. PsTaAH-137]MYT69881.1 DUF2752 domain-containing protein [Streptomyces sp. SID8367]RAJ88455.1 uncharacterized protein DUF2752 [Streptomyces sp. PsTaAH-137]